MVALPANTGRSDCLIPARYQEPYCQMVSAQLRMVGLTGTKEYTLGHVDPGTKFRYTANGHFDASHGSAARNEARSCRLEFTKA